MRATVLLLAVLAAAVAQNADDDVADSAADPVRARDHAHDADPTHDHDPAHAHEHELEDTSSPSAQFVCRRCGATLFHRHDYVLDLPPHAPAALKASETEPQLGPDGKVLIFSNPHGVRQSTAAFSRGRKVTSAATLHTEDSYFPGYGWRMAHCSACNNHVGWKFERLPTAGSKLKEALAASTAPPVKPPGTEPEAPDAPVESAAPAGDSSLLSPPRARIYDAREEADVLRELDGVCLTYPRGWWTYEYCHEKRVRQFHVEPDGRTDPDWSLGEFDRNGRVERSGVSVSAAFRGYYHSHFFIGGQRCDETKRGRSTEVQFFCCSNTPEPPRILSLEEPQLCKYRIQVCLFSVCDQTDAAASPTPAAKAASSASSASAPSSAKAASARANKGTTPATSGSGSTSTPGASAATTATTKTSTKSASSTSSAPPSTTASASSAASGTAAADLRTFFLARWTSMVGDQSEELRWMYELDMTSGISR